MPLAAGDGFGDRARDVALPSRTPSWTPKSGDLFPRGSARPPHPRGDPRPRLATDSIGPARGRTSSPVKTLCWRWEGEGKNDAKKAVEAERKSQAKRDTSQASEVEGVLPMPRFLVRWKGQLRRKCVCV